ncbi:MAG: hypothetical protein CL840_12000 [Crocinitomicaceae bacterium]|nr:hypothetical protein [Crocinitomicaceae bacterium]
MKEVIVVIPIYQLEFTKSEWLSLNQCFKELGDYPIVVIHPEGLPLNTLSDKFSYTSVSVDQKYFGSPKAYNKLMLSRFFYELFEDYNYLLICQTDVLVIKDNLQLWTKKDYDYIGAPWLDSYWQIWHNIFLKDGIVKGFRCLFTAHFYNAIGNGGFSLRKVSSCLEAFDREKTDLIKWNSNEDYYWGIFARKNTSNFEIPSKKEASKFSIETSPRKALYKLNKGQLPFGLHAWEKFDVSLWKEKLGLITHG